MFVYVMRSFMPDVEYDKEDMSRPGRVFDSVEKAKAEALIAINEDRRGDDLLEFSQRDLCWSFTPVVNQWETKSDMIDEVFVITMVEVE